MTTGNMARIHIIYNLFFLHFTTLMLDPLLPMFLHLQIHPINPVPRWKHTKLLVQGKEYKAALKSPVKERGPPAI